MKRLRIHGSVIVALAIAAVITGCAVRPHAPIPTGLTAEQALRVLADRQEAVSDFTARARTTFIENGVPQNATLALRYIAPGRCRIYIKVFGIDVARVSVLSDSITVYDALENYYFTMPRSSRYPLMLGPGIEVGAELIERLFATVVPEREMLAAYDVSITESADSAELTLTSNGASNRLTLTGEELLVTKEEYLINDTLIWTKTIDSYDSIDGILFPSSISVEYEQGSLTLSYSNIELNVGYTEDSLLFTIPPSADRYIVGP